MKSLDLIKCPYIYTDEQRKSDIFLIIWNTSVSDDPKNFAFLLLVRIYSHIQLYYIKPGDGFAVIFLDVSIFNRWIHIIPRHLWLFKGCAWEGAKLIQHYHWRMSDPSHTAGAVFQDASWTCQRGIDRCYWVTTLGLILYIHIFKPVNRHHIWRPLINNP